MVGFVLGIKGLSGRRRHEIIPFPGTNKNIPFGTRSSDGFDSLISEGPVPAVVDTISKIFLYENSLSPKVPFGVGKSVRKRTAKI